MTAEIAVLNRHAVALAADSAVTIQLPEGPKIYQTNKLFTLSKYHPVGFMIYGSAEFMGIPWETIVKQYRIQLGARSFPHLEDYANDVLRFLERNTKFFPRERQDSNCIYAVRAWLARLKNRLRISLEERFKAGTTLTEEAVFEMFRDIVREDIERLRKRRNLVGFGGMKPTVVLRRCRKPIRQAVTGELGRLTAAIRITELEYGCTLALMRDLYWHGESGIVIAGFGADDFLPALRSFRLDSIVAGRLRAEENLTRRAQIDTDGVSATVMAFAQSDMAALFMNGIDSDYSEFVRSIVSELLLKGYPSVVERALGNSLDPNRRSSLLKKLHGIGVHLSSKIEKAITDYAREVHSDPIVEIVNYLPKEELAAMAEALVNLTSFKRHVTRHAETVGGPIDVAVISRGDGFIWIKRKHYFTKNLNPQFTRNYFREGG